MSISSENQQDNFTLQEDVKLRSLFEGVGVGRSLWLRELLEA